jgi:hypothetical protein
MVKLGTGSGLSLGLTTSSLHPTDDRANMLIDKTSKYFSLMSNMFFIKNTSLSTYKKYVDKEISNLRE